MKFSVGEITMETKTDLAELFLRAGSLSLSGLFMRTGGRPAERAVVAALIKSGTLRLEDIVNHNPEIEQELQKKDHSEILKFLDANTSGETARGIEIVPTRQAWKNNFFARS
jgi:hypothetical protein